MEVKLRRAQAPKKSLKLEKSKKRKVEELFCFFWTLSCTNVWMPLESFALAERKSKPRKRRVMSSTLQLGSRNMG